MNSNTNNHLLSVSLITYNHEMFIAKALEGVLMQQTTFFFDIIVGEDCSTDNTRNILLNFKEQYPDKIRLLLPDNNQGMIENFKTTINQCKGKYIAYLDGDDYWTDPFKLQKQVDFLESNVNYSLCFHDFNIIKNNELIDNKLVKPQKSILTMIDLCKKNYIITSTVVFRNYPISFPAWFDNKLTFGDIPLFLLLGEKGDYYFLNERMGIYRIHAGGVYMGADRDLFNETTIYVYDLMQKHFKDKGVKSALKRHNDATLGSLLFYCCKYCNAKYFLHLYTKYFTKIPFSKKIKAPIFFLLNSCKLR